MKDRLKAAVREGTMYLGSVVVLLLVAPVAAILVQIFGFGHAADPLFTVLRWFVFWAVGVRLAIAGIRQMANPAFTAETIFRIHDRETFKIVQELGFANVSIGLIGLVSIAERGWVLPAGLAGAVFYGLAGIQHVRNARTTREETIAMVSDLLVFVVLGVLVGLVWTR
ncbi:MAG TPA: DUF6790 family protein [Hyphomicrobiales bacterium]|nr:DUF6790 family protein [Hyphomicrobiales bacterium]